MRFRTAEHLVVFTTLPFLCTAFTATVNTDAIAVGNAIFSGPGITVTNAQFLGINGAIGTFTDGPFGIGNGGILTTGDISGALAGGPRDVDNESPENDVFCGGTDSQNSAILIVDVTPAAGFNGISIEFILATDESETGQADAIAIYFLSLTDNLAVDSNGNRITAQSSFARLPAAIFLPDSVTAYSRSTPPLRVGVPVAPNVGYSFGFVICDFGDAINDSAFLIKGGACVNCDNRAADINYVTTTTTVAPGDLTSTSTIKPSGTNSGTFIVGVSATEVTTTTMAKATTTVSVASDTTVTTTSEPTTTTESTPLETTTITSEQTDSTTNESTTATMSISSEQTTETSGEPTTDTSGGATITTKVFLLHQLGVSIGRVPVHPKRQVSILSDSSNHENRSSGPVMSVSGLSDPIGSKRVKLLQSSSIM